MDAVRQAEERLDLGDARVTVTIARLAVRKLAAPDRPAQPLDLILARLDDGAQQVVAVGERAQLREADRLVAARRDREIVAEGIVELASAGIGRRLRRQRLERPEPRLGRDAADDVAQALDRALHEMRRERRRGAALRHGRIPSQTAAPVTGSRQMPPASATTSLPSVVSRKRCPLAGAGGREAVAPDGATGV